GGIRRLPRKTDSCTRTARPGARFRRSIARASPGERERFARATARLVHHQVERRLRTRPKAPNSAPLTVGKGGVEPPRPYGHTDLNRARLPFRHLPCYLGTHREVCVKAVETV